jgi:GAF domain-containing protein
MSQIQPNPFNREALVGEYLESWQNMLNIAAELLVVPAGLITRIDGREIEIFLSSQSNSNPYQVGYKTQYPDSGFYCEWVAKNRKPMIIPNARLDPDWQDNSAVGIGMISYLGLPIERPDGEIFGTICFLDNKENPHSETVVKLIGQFKRMVELTLHTLYAEERVRQQNRFFDDLSRIFPICAYCKKVCNDASEWIPVENYIKRISGHRASHGVCPQCYQREVHLLEKES